MILEQLSNLRLVLILSFVLLSLTPGHYKESLVDLVLTKGLLASASFAKDSLKHCMDICAYYDASDHQNIDSLLFDAHMAKGLSERVGANED